ncbi:hypothetical protein ACH4TV_27200 [Streptomyces sp. NPDC020898]|uniref:hypothetical protein n=1 Tax=Streptomyces sp. NPDC020898 TaxID=3365101 RepID=UPI00379DB444
MSPALGASARPDGFGAPGAPAPCGNPYPEAPGAPCAPCACGYPYEGPLAPCGPPGALPTGGPCGYPYPEAPGPPGAAAEAPGPEALSKASSSLNGGAKTVAGSGTERSSPASTLVVSVPVQGVAPGGTASAGTASEGAPETDGAAEAAPPPEAPAVEPDAEPARRSWIPSLSAASCNHSGGVSRKDVWLRSTRAGGAGTASSTAA